MFGKKLKADVTVESMVRHYLEIRIIGAEQLAALTGMARSSEDKRCLAILNDAISDGSVVYPFSTGRRSM